MVKICLLMLTYQDMALLSTLRMILKYIIITEFTKSTHDFEALWLEIDFYNQPKLLCGII